MGKVQAMSSKRKNETLETTASKKRGFGKLTVLLLTAYVLFCMVLMAPPGTDAATVVTGPSSTETTVRDDGTAAYVLSSGSSQITVVDPSNDTVLYTIPLTGIPANAAQSIDWNESALRLVVGCNNGMILSVDPALSTFVTLVNAPAANYALCRAENWTTASTFAWAYDSNTGWLHQVFNNGTVMAVAALPVGTGNDLAEKTWDASSTTIFDGYLLMLGTSATGFVNVDVFDRSTMLTSPLATWNATPANGTGIDSILGPDCYVSCNAPAGTPGYLIHLNLGTFLFSVTPTATYAADTATDVSTAGQFISVLTTNGPGPAAKLHIYDAGDPINVLAAASVVVSATTNPNGGLSTWAGEGTMDDIYSIYTNQGSNGESNSYDDLRDVMIEPTPGTVTSNLWPVTTPAEVGALGQEAIICTECPPRDAGGRGRLAGIPGGVEIAYSGSERSVQYATGEEIYVQPLFSVPGVGLDLEFNLTYRSRRDFNYRYGQGWFLNQDVRLKTETNGDRTYQSPYGRMDTYQLQPGGAYISPAHYDTTLNTSGSTTITNRFGKVLAFDANGYRTSEADRYGNTISYTYQNDQLTQITDTVGRNYSLSYDASGRLTSVTDYGGRTWSMKYDYLGQLRYVRTPTSTQFPQGRKHWFSYSGNNPQARFRSNQVHVWSAKGERIQTLSYNSNDRVSKEAIGPGTYDFSYDVMTQTTTVVDRSGNTSKWTFDSLAVLTRLERFTKGLRVGEPASYATTYGVGANGMVNTVVHPAGNRTELTYDASLNLTALRLKETNTGTNGPTDIIWNYQYTGPYNQLSQTVDPLGNVTNMTIDGSGNRTLVSRPTVTSPATQSISESFTYDGQGRMLTATDGAGQAVALAYHTTGPQTGYLQSVTKDPLGLALTTTFAYDQYGNVTSVTDPKGNATTVTLDAESFVTEITAPAPLSYRRRVTYDANRNVTKLEVENIDRKGVQDPTTPWIPTTFAYDEIDRLTSTTVKLDASTDATTTYAYDGTGFATAVTHPEGNKDAVTYDERLLVFQVTRGVGATEASTTTYDYDVNGNLLKVTDGRGNATDYAYDKFNRRTKMTNPLGHYVDLAYDSSSNVTSVSAYDVSAVLQAKSVRHFDELNRTWKEVLHRFGPGIPTTFPTTTITRDRASRITQVKDPLNNSTSYTYDLAGRIATETDAIGNKITYTYDANGNVTKVAQLEVPATGGSETFVTDFEYDALNRRTKMLEVDRLNSSNKLTTTFEYDSRNNLAFRTDAEGNPVRWSYDLASRLTKHERALQVGAQIDIFLQSLDETVAYDKNNRVSSETDDNFNATGYTYDALNRRTKITYADTKAVSLTYDKNSNLSTKTDQNGSVITNVFDSLDRLTSRSIVRGTGVLGTSAESYTYDALGRVLTAVDDDYQVEFTWDSVGNTLTEKQGYTAIGQEKWKTVTAAFTDAGSLSGITYPSGFGVTHTRDAVYRLTAIWDLVAQANVATFQWQGLGRISQTNNQNGTVTEYTYDGFRRTASIDHTVAGGNTFHKFDYAYDKVHNRRMEKNTFSATWIATLPAAVQTFLNGRNIKGDVYAYDMAYRMVDARYDVVNPAAEVTTPGSQTYARLVQYTIDGLGNRSQVATTVPPATPTTVSYASDVVNQYTAIGGTSRTHDSNGNLSDDGTHKFVYDYENRLVEVKASSTSTSIATYKYDALGRRVEKSVVAGAKTRYILCRQQVIEEYDGTGAWQAEYVYEDGIDRPRSMNRADVSDVNGNSNTTEVLRFHYHQNALGSVTEVSQPTGAIVEWVTYDAYGTAAVLDMNGTAGTQSALGSPYLFAAREWDPESNKYYYRARSYDPTTGRFIQRDPLGYVDGMSAYEYVRSSPVDRRDPMGLESTRLKEARDAQRESGKSREAYRELKREAQRQQKRAEIDLKYWEKELAELRERRGRGCDRRRWSAEDAARLKRLEDILIPDAKARIKRHTADFKRYSKAHDDAKEADQRLRENIREIMADERDAEEGIAGDIKDGLASALDYGKDAIMGPAHAAASLVESVSPAGSWGEQLGREARQAIEGAASNSTVTKISGMAYSAAWGAGGGARAATTRVAHFTDDVGAAAIRGSGHFRKGTYVAKASEVPRGALPRTIEKFLEIAPGKGARRFDFRTWKWNLKVPANGLKTSGGAWQRQLRRAVKVP